MRRTFSIQTIIEYLSVLFIAALILTPILYFYLYSYEISDINFHTEYARELFEAPQKADPALIAHSAWHWTVIITNEILGNYLGKSWRFSAFIVTLGCELFTVGILFWYLRKKISPLLAGAIAICMMIIEPLLLFAPQGNTLKLGYIWINTHYNPTSFFLKPFAILQFIFSVGALQGKNTDWKCIILAALTSIIAAFAKPSYAICLLPGLGILSLLSIWRKKPLDWKMLWLGIGLPSIAILIWQYFLVYGSGGEESRIIFAPFLVMLHSSSHLLIKYVLSIVFPLVVTVIYWKESSKDIGIQLGWMGFGIGTIFTYLFAESGWRYTSGNFTWTGEITLFILFVCCILFLSEKKLPGKNSMASWFVFSSGSLHIISGIYNYLFSLSTKPPPY